MNTHEHLHNLSVAARLVLKDANHEALDALVAAIKWAEGERDRLVKEAQAKPVEAPKEA